MMIKHPTALGLLLLSWSLVSSPTAFARDKTDVVLLRNGDRLTGEIQSLEYGLLRLSTDDIGTVSIEWQAIASIDSNFTFDVEQVGGRRYFGVIGTSADGQNLVVQDGAMEQVVPFATVVRVSELESGFWQRVSGSLAVGFNYTKSSGIRTGNLNINSTYQAEQLRATLDISFLETGSPETESTSREQISSTVQFRGERPAFWLLLNSLERNEELGIKARLQSGAGIARYFQQDADSEVLAAVGIVANEERTFAQDDSQQSLEAVLSSEWRIFRFSDPEVSLTASAALYPGITESGRLRGDLDISLRREIISDLFFELSLYESYDSDPPFDDTDPTAPPPPTTDYGIVTSLGYKF